MTIQIEIYDLNQEFTTQVFKNLNIIADYFNFQLNDIDLYKMKRILEEGKFSCYLNQIPINIDSEQNKYENISNKNLSSRYDSDQKEILKEFF